MSDGETELLSEEARALAEQCNERHVRFIQCVLSGKFDSNTAAYQFVYPESSYDASRDSASKVLAIPCNKALYSQLREEQLMEGVLSRAEAMKILSDMASTSMGDLVVFGTVEAGTNEDGEPVHQAVWKFKDSQAMTAEQLRSISEVTAGRDGLRIKQHDQKAAIKQLAEMAGWNEPKKIDIDVSDSAYLARLRAALTSDE